ncbi:hypothetical protein P692DRAFT_201810275 [Suillus brevipes Sb2]|nr:hypothetical protein P692DRAFT_201810275 [Suillus brevipes Sb2]
MQGTGCGGSEPWKFLSQQQQQPQHLHRGPLSLLMLGTTTTIIPLYASIGNIHNNVRRAHCSGVVIVGFLAMPKNTQEYAFRKFRRHLFHSSLSKILESLILTSLVRPKTAVGRVHREFMFEF